MLNLKGERFSVVIPAYNAEKTICQCLEAVFASKEYVQEVIIVNDASIDRTVELARRFPCRIIELKQNRGPAYSRMLGLKETTAEIVVFIDADVLVDKSIFSELLGAFSTYSDATAIVGMLSKKHPNKDFFSQYKNLYMHYIFSQCPLEIDFIYGAFYAVKKKYYTFMPLNKRYGEDTEFGMHLTQQGLKIILEKKIQVVHLKKYSLFSFIKNDFLIPFYWARLFLLNKGWRAIKKEKRFFHAQKEQLISVALVPIILIALFLKGWLAVLLIPLQFLLNLRFFIFLEQEKGLFFTLSSLVVTWLDWLIMSAGIVCGFCVFLLRRMLKGFI